MKQTALASALALLGCGPSLSTARTAVNAATVVYDQTKRPIEAQYEADQLACLDRRPAPPEPCVTQVREAWKPVKEAETAFYRALLLAQNVVSVAEAGAALGKHPDARQVLAVVASAVEAGEKLRDAIQELQKLASRPADAPKPKPGPWVPWTGPSVTTDKPAGGVP